MKKFIKFLLKTALALFVFFVGICLAGILWLKTGNLSSAKDRVLQKIPVPVAFVDGTPIWSTEYFTRIHILSELRPKEITLEAFQKTTYNRMLEERTMDRILSGKKGGYFKPTTKTSAEKLLADWEAKQVGLKIWYFSQEKLNLEMYLDAGTLDKMLQEGKSFESLAEEYSKDRVSKAYFGDLGYVETKDILPEILRATDTMALGDIKKVASRQGLHIIKLEDRDNLGLDNGQRIHLKQIFLPGLGFEKWLKNETDKIHTIKLLNI